MATNVREDRIGHTCSPGKGEREGIEHAPAEEANGPALLPILHPEQAQEPCRADHAQERNDAAARGRQASSWHAYSSKTNGTSGTTGETTGYFPLKTAGRFSRKATVASWASSVTKQRMMASISFWKARSSSASNGRLSNCLLSRRARGARLSKVAVKACASCSSRCGSTRRCSKPIC